MLSRAMRVRTHTHTHTAVGLPWGCQRRTPPYYRMHDFGVVCAGWNTAGTCHVYVRRDLVRAPPALLRRFLSDGEGLCWLPSVYGRVPIAAQVPSQLTHTHTHTCARAHPYANTYRHTRAASDCPAREFRWKVLRQMHGVVEFICLLYAGACRGLPRADPALGQPLCTRPQRRPLSRLASFTASLGLVACLQRGAHV